MDLIRLVIHVIFLSFFYWFLFSVIRAMDRDMKSLQGDDSQRPGKASTRGGD